MPNTLQQFTMNLSYIIKHKWHVFLACVRLGIPFLGIVHDLCKFMPDEFIPYMHKFYGSGSENSFQRALFLHYRRTKHHWQYWIVPKFSQHSAIVTIEIPKRYCKEMVADWIGFARGDVTAAIAWYTANQHSLALHYNSRAYIETILRELS